ncbi:MAG: FG-GAP-like repeat-containing protein [Kiritimatiellia bacterium]
MSDYTVEPGRLYYYWLRAKTHVVPLSTFSESSHGGTPPSPPTAVIASKGVPTNYVEIVWNASDYTTEYRLYRAFVNDPEAPSVTNLAAGDFTDYDDHTVTPGRTHYYWVKAVNAQGYVSAFSAGDGIANSGGIQPSPPATLTAGKGLTSTNVPLSWSSVPYAAGYVVYRSTELNPTFAQAIVTNQAPDTTAGDPRTVPFLPYHYWVRATNQYGFSDYSVSDFGYTILLPPLSVEASGDQTNRVAVTWVVESTNATRYMIYRGATTNAADAVLQVEVPYLNNSATNYHDYSITRGVEYYYFLRAKNVYGISDFSEPSNRGGTFPTAPTGLSATDGSEENAVILTWSPPASPGTRGYRLYRSTSFDPGTASLLASTEVGDREHHDTGSEPGRYYYYWATATNLLGSSKFSGITSGWRPLSKPGHLSAEQGASTNHINVTWSAARNATHYEIWRGTSTNLAGAEKLQNSWTELVYPDSENEAGTIYYYWLRAKNDSFISAYTDPAQGFRALGAVDLAADSLIFHPNVLAPESHPTALSFQLSNRGPQTMLPPNSRVSVDFYLSDSPQFVEQDAYWLGGLNLDLSMAPGNGRARSLTASELAALSIPHLPDGHYYVFMHARHQLPSKWNDPVPGNNHVRRLGGAIRISPQGGARQVLHDYDGDGKTDPAVYRESDGAWAAWLSGANYTPATAANYGGPGFAPIPADYDGDGKTDPAVYREADGAWTAWLSLDNYALISVDNHGGPGWQPAPGGYDYDTFVDPAVYHASSGTWRIWPSSQGYRTHNITGWGQAGLAPIPGDYNGDGLNDLAIYHKTTGYWFIRTLAGETLTWGTHWGGADFLPAPGDYNGDGRMDLAVYHIPTGAWYVRTVTGGVIAGGTIFGGPGFVPAGNPSN